MGRTRHTRKRHSRRKHKRRRTRHRRRTGAGVQSPGFIGHGGSKVGFTTFIGAGASTIVSDFPPGFRDKAARAAFRKMGHKSRKHKRKHKSRKHKRKRKSRKHKRRRRKH